MHWDQEEAAKLRKLGLNQEQIGAVLGIIAEHRQVADREGVIRGYDSGYTDGKAAMRAVIELVEKPNQTVSTDALLHLMREVKAISDNHVIEISASTQIFDQISSIVPRLNPGKMSPDELAVVNVKGVKILKEPAFEYNQYMLIYANGRIVIDYSK